jgi:hypothetical protein
VVAGPPGAAAAPPAGSLTGRPVTMGPVALGPVALGRLAGVAGSVSRTFAVAVNDTVGRVV